jgi:hypothetical protein
MTKVKPVESGPSRNALTGQKRIRTVGSLRPAQILEPVEPALAGANEIDVAVAVDVDGRDLQAGAGGSSGEVLLSVTLGTFLRRVLGGLGRDDHDR